jgi:hypothetical protein
MWKRPALRLLRTPGSGQLRHENEMKRTEITDQPMNWEQKGVIARKRDAAEMGTFLRPGQTRRPWTAKATLY